jgi:signal peptidase I
MKSLDELRSENSKNKKNTPAGKSQQEKPSLGQSLFELVKTLLGAIIIVMILNGVLIASFVVPTPSMENTVMTGDFLFVNKFVYGPSTPQIIPFINVPVPFYKFPGLKDPERGDVIVFIFPGYRDQPKADEFQYYLKRAIGIAGDTVEVRNKQAFVNGVAQDMPDDGLLTTLPLHPNEQYKTFPVGQGNTRDNYGPIVVPKQGDVITISPENISQWDTFIRREGHKVGTSGSQVLIDGTPAKTYTVERNYCFAMGDNRDRSLDSRYWGFVPYDNVVGTPLVVYWSWDTNNPSFMEKLSSVRWDRLGTFID